MMAGDGEGERQARDLIPGESERRSHSGMLDRLAATAQPRLKLGPGLPKVVPQPREPPPLSGVERRREFLGADSHGAEVRLQLLPLALRATGEAVGEESGHILLRFALDELKGIQLRYQ